MPTGRPARSRPARDEPASAPSDRARSRPHGGLRPSPLTRCEDEWTRRTHPPRAADAHGPDEGPARDAMPATGSPACDKGPDLAARMPASSWPRDHGRPVHPETLPRQAPTKYLRSTRHDAKTQPPYGAALQAWTRQPDSGLAPMCESGTLLARAPLRHWTLTLQVQQTPPPGQAWLQAPMPEPEPQGPQAHPAEAARYPDPACGCGQPPAAIGWPPRERRAMAAPGRHCRRRSGIDRNATIPEPHDAAPPAPRRGPGRQDNG